MADRTNKDGPAAMRMMVLALVCCLGILLLALLIPALGWPAGLAVGTVAIAAMLVAHRRMGHRHHS